MSEDNAVATAEAAGLKYVDPDSPGWTRRRRGRGWSYHRADGSLIRQRQTRERLNQLAIPPAWTDVWIAPRKNGHIQARGRDMEGRWQYRYHPDWRAARDMERDRRALRLARLLPEIEAFVEKALERDDLGRQRVLAGALRMLRLTGIRVGYEEYARDNDSYGLATLRDRHVRVRGANIVLAFEAKGGTDVEMTVRDASLAKLIAACKAVPGYEVLVWMDDDGSRHDVTADDVNQFIREVSGQEDFSAKDFRTWFGTVAAFRCMVAGDCPGPGEHEGRLLAAVDRAAEFLHNTRDVARDSYVHQGLQSLCLDHAAVQSLPWGSQWDDSLGASCALLDLLAE